MKTILISGKAGHGKDTVASIMKEELERRNEKVLIIKFGDPVKWFAREYYNWNGEKDEVGRSLLQYIGTEMMRHYDSFYWGRFISEFIAANKDFSIALIPDWRFISEKIAIAQENKNYYTLRVERPNFKNPQMTEEQLKHISETELDKYLFDYTIYNDGNLIDLHEKVKSALDYFEKIWYNKRKTEINICY